MAEGVHLRVFKAQPGSAREVVEVDGVHHVSGGNLLDEVEEIGSGIARRLDLITDRRKLGAQRELTTLLKSETGPKFRRSSFRRSNRCYGSRSATAMV